MKRMIFICTLVVSLIGGAVAFAGPDDIAYFKQFLFQKENISDDPDFPEYQYRWVMTKYNDMVKMPDGRYLNPAVNLFLYEDNTYLMTYQENYFQKPDDTGFIPGPCKRITGTWSVPDKELVLDGVGRANRTTVDGEHALTVTYDKDLNSPGLAGHSVEARLGYANSDQVFCF